MKYFFPHQSRDKKKAETVKLFTKYLACSVDILEDVSRQIITETRLLEHLVALPIEGGHVEWTLEQWQAVCIENGFERVPEDWLNNLGENGSRETFSEWTKESARIFQKDGFVIAYDKDLSNWWHWHWWNRNVSAWDKRLQLINESSFDLRFLEQQDISIYSHEAFLILMGISSDDLDRDEFRIWFFETAPQRFIDYPQIEEYGLKQNYTEFKEWRTLKRRFNDDKDDLFYKIDTQTFIKWALDNKLIEQSTAHYRDGRKAKYDESFSFMLHKLLLEKGLILDCEHDDEWTWNISVENGANSFNYLGRMLAKNRVPMVYWLPIENAQVSWKNLEHYIVGVKSPKSHTSEPKNAIDIEYIIKELMVEHDDRPLTEFKYLDDED